MIKVNTEINNLPVARVIDIQTKKALVFPKDPNDFNESFVNRMDNIPKEFLSKTEIEGILVILRLAKNSENNFTPEIKKILLEFFG